MGSLLLHLGTITFSLLPWCCQACCCQGRIFCHGKSRDYFLFYFSMSLCFPHGQEETWRLCGDYRRLNTTMVTDHYHFPNITNFTSHFSGSIIFLSWIYRRSITRCQSSRRSLRRRPSSPLSECWNSWWCCSVSGMLVLLLCVHGQHPYL